MVIGAIVSFGAGERVVCAAIAAAPRRLPDGIVDRVTIPFLPMSEAAFRASVVSLDGNDGPPAEFREAIQNWSEDPRGLSIFTVPFDGFLDRLIARQMKAIIGQPAA